MEHTLGGDDIVAELLLRPSLNPCFSGTYSRRQGTATPADTLEVLILVLVEHTLGVGNLLGSIRYRDVLILVLVEHTLGD